MFAEIKFSGILASVCVTVCDACRRVRRLCRSLKDVGRSNTRPCERVTACCRGLPRAAAVPLEICAKISGMEISCERVRDRLRRVPPCAAAVSLSEGRREVQHTSM